MGKIVGAFATVHAPQIFVRPPTEIPEQLDADIAAMRLMGKDLDELKPDAVIILGSDHLETFFLSSVPTFAVIAGEYTHAHFANKSYKVKTHLPLAEDILNKLVADGTLVAYGNFSVLNHQEGQPTHGSWFSARSMANIIKVLEGLRSGPDATGPVFAASKHWDLILESRNYNAHSGTFKNGYLRVGSWKYRAGASDPDGKIMKATMVAMLEKLLADGALHAYQIDEESVHSSDPDGFYVAIVANGAEGLDKFYAALDENDKKNPAGMAGYGSLLDSKGHRDTLSHVDTMTHK